MARRPPIRRNSRSCCTRRKLRLGRGRHLTDFVKKQHPARRQFDLSGLREMRSRERAALEPEQLRLEQRVGQCRAIDRDERAAAARRGTMDEPRHHLLSHTGLALQTRCSVRRRDLDRPPQHFMPGRAPADRAAGEADVVEEPLAPPRARVPIHGTICGGVVTCVAHAHNRTHHIPQSRGRTYRRLLLLLKCLPAGLA